ncbi:MAG TPA: glyceraldehyde 3-phosphate dehydrogenase NAD-binding domain-containing protein [Noviherbaspirillum sp.]|uniref:type I glyceraldehyde-3-phosphate dehydrogenase n=1 Tax=Noviherbaspirillum sp. TaxID=1926288 RepID=UPI002B490D76|nr:glyceraldehyde 3-phosphate dehydrogenase NAD-binding domain-containing protein [Noviherbaspirillum sp.]HJV87692.1 glyceraldehyde 3-phosphate dehydrogenase NAD-binding domain-containing protein [Noviherbaspirillum sp.]
MHSSRASSNPSDQPVRLAINGYGRIGRCFLRALYESPLKEQFQVVAINEPADLATIAYLSRFDSTHGVFPGKVEAGDHQLIIDGQPIHVSHAKAPEAVDWAGLGVDLLVECSGQYAHRNELQRFLDAGCPRLLLSHPGHSAQDVDRTIVYGINHGELVGDERIVSNASCTTNAIVPVLDRLDRAFGVEHALMTTLHSVMNDQPLIDSYHHSDLRRTRSAMQSIIPVSTGLARGVERLMPQLAGRVQAKAMRVPVINVSAIDLVVSFRHEVSIAQINALFSGAASEYAGLFAYSDDPHASVDFNHNPHSAIVDGSQTRTIGPHIANLLVWFDNEWGFANRLLDVAQAWQQRFVEL